MLYKQVSAESENQTLVTWGLKIAALKALQFFWTWDINSFRMAV